MSYVLESQAEFDRLEEQSGYPEYDFMKELELASLRLRPEAVILDAGSGSGVVSRHFGKTFPKASVVGCDVSPGRVALAQQAADESALKNVRFQSEDLSKLSFKTGTFDLVFCRYVIEHVPGTQRQAAFDEMVRCLKPDGQLCIVDFDGVLFNLHPQTSLVAETLVAFERANQIDLKIGRKLPGMFHEAGLTDIRWSIETIACQGEAMQREIGMMREKLELARGFFEALLGSGKKAERFIADYIDGMSADTAVLFYNKFVVTGRKAKQFKVVR